MRSSTRRCWCFAAGWPNAIPRNYSFLAGVALFTAASAACALANSVETLVAFRLAAGRGRGAAHPDVIGPDPGDIPGGAPRRRGPHLGRGRRVRRRFGAAGGRIAGHGQLAVDFSGQRADRSARAGWWVGSSFRRVPGHDVPVPNIWAAALITAGIATLTFGIVKLNDWGWNAPAVALSFAAAAAMLALFVAHCLRSDNPFIDPALFRIRDFTRATLTMAPFSTAFGGFLLSLVLWEEGVWHWPAMKIGLAIAPGPFMVPVTSLLLAGRLIARFGAATVVAAGLVVFAAGVIVWAVLAGPRPRPGVRCPLRHPVGHRCRADAADADGARHVGASGVVVRDRVRRDQHGSPDRFRRRRRHLRRHRRIARARRRHQMAAFRSRLVGDGGDHRARPDPAASAAAKARRCGHGTRTNRPGSHIRLTARKEVTNGGVNGILYLTIPALSHTVPTRIHN